PRLLGGGPGAGARAGAGGRPGRRGLAGGAPRARGRLLVLVVRTVGGDPSPAPARRGVDDLVLVVLGLGRDLGLRGLQLGGVVHPGSVRVELLVGQLVVADGARVVVAFRLLVAHCASLVSSWWPLCGYGGLSSVVL